MAGNDTLPAGPARVVLHRVGSEVQGPVDSMQAGASGRFRFRFAADPSAIYLLSARYAGIEYFSAPVATNPAAPDTALVLVVSDTSSGTPVGIAIRHFVISRPERAGPRRIVDFVVLRNAGNTTRVAPGTEGTVFGFHLPAGAAAIEVQDETEFSRDAVRIRNGMVEILAPFAPGDRQVLLQYDLPAGLQHATVPLEGPVETLSVLMEETDLAATGIAFAPADTVRVGGRLFHRISGSAPGPAVLDLRFPSSGLSQGRTVALLVGVIASAFLALALVLTRRRSGGRLTGRREPANGLIDEIARLDAAHRARDPARLTAEEVATYHGEREALLRRLRAGLAGRSGSP